MESSAAAAAGDDDDDGAFQKCTKQEQSLLKGLRQELV